jgi:hypothetical protein
VAGSPDIPKRYAIARRWQWPAAVGAGIFMLTCFVGWPLGYLWPSAAAFVLFVPAVVLFNIKCHACGYPAFGDYQADQRAERDTRLWTRFWGKEYSGAHLPLRSRCSKCGAHFTSETDQAPRA